MMQILGMILLTLMLFYQWLPNLIERHFDRKVFHRISTQNNQIALTFDDGPHPVYTPKLLDCLQAHHIHATFFLVAKQAQAYPEIVNRMVEEGHAVGLHSLDHRGFWLKTPRQTRLDFEESLAIFQALKLKPVGFRPPWGTFNALTSHYASKAGLSCYLWSRNAKDWKIKTQPEAIVTRISQHLLAGEIIVLHDAGGKEKAPQHTLEALQIALPELKKTFNFVRLAKGGPCHDLDAKPVS